MATSNSTGATQRKPRVAWIGLGNMGRGMVSNIANKSDAFEPPIHLYNRTTSRAEELCAKLTKDRTSVATSIEAAVSSADMIFTILYDDAAVEETLLHAMNSPGGIKGKLIVDCTTISAKMTTKIEKMVTNAGGRFVAMPVFGAAPMADAGQLICVPAGPGASVEELRPFIEAVSRASIDLVDEPPSKAAMLKLLGNSMMIANAQSLSEGHVVAEKSGLGTANFHKFVELFMPGPFVMYSNRMMNGDYFKRKEPISHVENGVKDLQYLLELAAECDAPMKNAEHGRAQLLKVRKHAAQTNTQADAAQIYGVARLDAGLPFENDG